MEYRNQHLQSGCLCTVSISPVRSEHSRRTHSIINNFSLVVDARPRYKKHPCPSCCAVAQHRMDRGACVYCRLLSVLLMQIIKFGGKLVVNPRCSSIERHNFKRNKAIFCVLLLNRLHRGDVARISPVFVQQAPTTSTIPGNFLKNPPTSSNSVHESCVQFWSQPFFDGA